MVGDIHFPLAIWTLIADNNLHCRSPIVPPRERPMTFRYIGGQKNVERTQMASTPYNHVATFTCTLTVESGVTVEYLDELEASMDCLVCKRRHRTVIFHRGERWPKCTGRQNCNGFCGELETITQSSTGREFTGTYVIRFAYLRFTDLKHNNKSKGDVRWGRVHLRVNCPSCGVSKDSSIQTNSVRPFTYHCECGYALFTETVEMPVIECTSTAPYVVASLFRWFRNLF